MLDNHTLLLISAVLDASLDEMQKRGLSLGSATRRLFALAESGERDPEVLKAAVLDLPNNADLPDDGHNLNS
jgi:hypothetical protein